MTWWESAIIGIVEGLTEYLPVSSTGHIILTQRLLGIPKTEASDAFAVVIQAGAILAVVGLYWQRVKGMLLGLLGKDTQGLLLLRNILLAFLPAAILGKLFDDKIEAHLLGLWPVTTAWFVGGVMILAVAWFRRGTADKESNRGLETITPPIALAIGLLQCCAMWPGTSRSLMVIVAGLLFGLHMAAAVEFSFILGMITLSAASAYKSLTFFKHPELLQDYSIATMAVGTLTAWVAAVISVKWMVGFLKKSGLQPFGWYRIALAAVVTSLLAAGWIHPG